MGTYFRQKILEENVITFLKDSENVLDPADVCFLHDSAPCFRANEMQNLMESSGIDFFDRTQQLENSPDLNPAEHLGAILKDSVEAKMIKEVDADRYSKGKLMRHLQDVLEELEFDTNLFESLLRSYPSRLQAVRDANGFHTKY